MQENDPSPVTTETRGAVLLVWIDNPPVNALGHALRAALAGAIEAASLNPGVRAVALLAKGRTFPAGADISEFGKPPQPPLLPDLCKLVESCPKPVVAGLHGTALGGGLELALSAHARIALSDARVGLPEVGLGILPGAGGTQRLPRLIGAPAALRMMITGKPISAEEALSLGLLDRVVERDLADATVTLALHMAANPPVPTRDRREGMADAKAYFSAIATARAAQVGTALPGPARIIDCVEAAMLLPFDQGLAFERAAFAELVVTPEAEALRHVFFAERRAGRMLGAKAKAQKLERISIVGAAADAVALTREVLAAGYEVTLIDGDGDALAKGLESVAHGLASDLAAGKLSQTEYDAHWARVQPGLPGEDGDAADLVFVTGPYRHADAKVPGIAATSGAPIVTLGRVGTGGQRALGLVMMPPTQNGRLAEMLVTPDSDAETVATLLALLKRMRRSVIQGQGAGICAGLSSAFSKSLQVLEDKHGPEPVLEVLTRWGMVRDRDRHSNDPASLDLWSGLAAPMLGALANAGLRLYGDEAALRPSDIDLAMVLGLGFPRWGGGPMLWAARRGLLVLRDDLMEWEKDDAALWSPAPVLDGLIREGISLDALNDG